jgi:hypothetical protein
MTSIAGIDIYPMISLLIFFIFFVGLFIHVVRMRKTHIDYMSSRPLEDNLPESHHNSNS